MKRPKPDYRLNWRDQQMPVLRDYIMGDGSHRIEVDPDYERGYREFLMETTSHPSYKTDPTYEMRKDKRK